MAYLTPVSESDTRSPIAYHQTGSHAYPSTVSIGADKVREALGDIPDFLIRTRDPLYDHGGRPNAWVGEPGSQCRIESASQAAGPGGLWGDKPFRWAAETCGMYLAAAAEHLRCLGLMLDQQGFLMSPEVITRAIYELTMRVAWILDNEATPRQRAARVYMESFHGLRRALEGYSRLWTDVAVALKHARQQIFESDVPDLFWPNEINFGDNIPVREWSLAGESYPSPEDIVALLATRSEISVREVAGMYAVLSAYVHPNPVELQRRLVPSGDGRGQGLSVTPSHLRQLVGSSVAAFYQAYRLQATYLGWDPDVFAAWESDAGSVVPEAFSPEGEDSI